MHGAKLLTAIAVLACAGCNTMSGLGRDLQEVGGALARTADETKGEGRSAPAARSGASEELDGGPSR